MRRWITVFCPLIVIFILVSYGFTLQKVEVPNELKVNEPTAVLFPKDEIYFENLKVNPPYLGTSLIGFKEALAFKESQGNYFVVNTYGYLGKYQFGKNTLELMGVTNENQFLKNPALQEKVFEINLSRNKWILRRDIKKFVGLQIGGIKVTESGILAAAHLAGAGNVKTYLRSYGKVDVIDGYGTTIANYLKKFSGYDLSLIEAKKNPRI